MIHGDGLRGKEKFGETEAIKSESEEWMAAEWRKNLQEETEITEFEIAVDETIV
jgi:hypothetical protein